ncbi:MFS transporter [Bacillus mangrovi]|uniref:MFS transporter n=1 Tax=Metabacillus mangrovi TaxID=1491830 RepID=A0A7X2S7Y6_9BACI|nr:MFS transporter [Metabacillus mangrovi]MTH55284.1 MFS transporter [Metabacillus mangrovi]
MRGFNRDFKILVFGQIISIFGSSVLRFALSLYVLDLTNSATVFGTIMGLSILPAIVISPIGGAIADRFDKKKIMVLLDLCSSFLIILFAVFLLTGNGTVVSIGVLLMALTFISSMYQPAVQSSIPVIVQKELLLKSNGIVSGVVSLANFAGPIAGSVLYSVTSMNVIVIVSALLFFAAAIIQLFMKIPSEKRAEEPFVKMVTADIKEGISYIVHGDRFILKSISIAFIVSLFIAPMFFVGLPYMIKVLFNMPDTYFGFTQSGISLSIIFSAMVIGLLKNKIRNDNLYLWITGCAAVYFGMAFGTSQLVESSFVKYLIVSLSSMLVMFALTVVTIYLNTIIQKKTPGNMLGKVMSIQTAAATTAVPIGQILFGFLVDRFSSQISLLIAGVGVLSLLIGLMVKRVYRGKTVQEPFPVKRMDGI